MAALTKIQWASPFQWHYDQPNVGVNKYMVIASKTDFLATSDLACCFAVCTRGKTKDGTPVLGLCHTTLTISHENTIQILKEAMVAKGCIEKTIEVFVVGGGRFEAAEASTEEDEQEIQEMQQDGVVKESLLNLTNSEDEPVNLVLTPQRIYLSKAKPLFEINEEKMDLGEDLGKKDWRMQLGRRFRENS